MVTYTECTCDVLYSYSSCNIFHHLLLLFIIHSYKQIDALGVLQSLKIIPIKLLLTHREWTSVRARQEEAQDSKSRSAPGGTQSVAVIFKRAMGETERARDRMKERREVKMNVLIKMSRQWRQCRITQTLIRVFVRGHKMRAAHPSSPLSSLFPPSFQPFSPLSFPLLILFNFSFPFYHIGVLF